jgi:polynucleotide 5'-hydroxyl-kinase GRC3/NOL9
MESGSTTLVCGPKGAGKSTLAQLLVNTLLTLPHLRKDSDSTLAHVAFLDLDPGQPHFTPSGHISLSILHHPFWGPPYTHPGFPVDGKTRTTSKIIRSHFVAATTPKHDPRHFDDCIRDLMARYSQFSRTCDACPLVVNCPGWIQGPGFEFMKRTVRLIVPDHIVYMSQEGPQRVVDGIQRAAGRARIHILPSQESQNKARTALDLRTMQTMSYFHLSSHRSDHLLWTSDPVANHTSWDFEYTGRNRGVFGIMIADENCQATQLCGLLDGSLAGIVVLDDDSALDPDPEAEYIHLKIEGHPQADRDEQDQSGPSNGVGSNDQDVDEPLERLLRTTKESLPYIPGPLPSPSKSHCIGLGYVRNIDTRTQTMQIVTPISKSYIAHLQEEERKLILVLGRLDTPGWAYAEEAIKSHFWWRRRTRAGDSGSQPPSEETAGEKKRITELVQRSPWLKERSKKEKRPGEGPWKVRRNLVLR